MGVELINEAQNANHSYLLLIIQTLVSSPKTTHPTIIHVHVIGGQLKIITEVFSMPCV